MILAGDIGGTHTRLALFSLSGKLAIAEEKKYKSREFQSLSEIVREFITGRQSEITSACFGVAGPVRNGRCQATNLPWVVEVDALKKVLGINSVHLLNDLEANAYGVKAIDPNEITTIHHGQKQAGNQALISAGTGLGEAGFFWDGSKHHPFACEGGHADFAPKNQDQFELFLYMKKRYGHVSYERVVSGPGILAIYQFLIETGRSQRSSEVEEQMKQRDPSMVVSEYGRLEKDAGCSKAVDWFLSFYGAEASNLALKVLALGGVFIGGGIAPNMADRLKKGTFYASFVDKGRFNDLLSSIPIYLIKNENTALFGSAAYARGL